jgi:hypothetical protein
MEASMHGTFDKSGESNNRIGRGWGIGFFAIPVLLVIALIGLAVTHPSVSSWISEAAQAEFASTDLLRDVAPSQLAQPGPVTRTVKAY